MAIAYFGGGSWGGTGNSGSVTYTLPSSIPVGAIIITFRVTGTTNAGGGPYTALQHWADTNVEGCITWKVADGTEATFSASELTGSERTATIVMVFTGVDTTTPFIVENTSTQTGTSTTLATATVNNTDANAWRVSFFGYRTSTLTDTGNWWTSTDVEKFDVACTSNSNDPRIAGYSSDATIATGNTSVTGTSASTSDAVAWIGILKPGGATVSGDVASTVTDTITSTASVTNKPVDATVPVTATQTAALAGSAKPVDVASTVTATETAALAGSTKPVDSTRSVTATQTAALGGSIKSVDVDMT